MIKQLFYKWFGIEPQSCLTCEVLRDQLDESNRERRELLARLLEKDKSEPPVKESVEPPQPITPQYTPWRMRRQMLEQEDRRTAQLMKDKAKEIAELEKELDIPSVSSE